MLDSQKKAEIIKSKMQESRNSETVTETKNNSSVNAVIAILSYFARVIIFYFALNIVLDKFKIQYFGFWECFLIFVAIVGIAKSSFNK